MREEGVGVVFVALAIKTALKYEGVYDLMNLWTKKLIQMNNQKLFLTFEK